MLDAESIRLARGVGMLTLPPIMPTSRQDDECFRCMAEPFIVFRFGCGPASSR